MESEIASHIQLWHLSPDTTRRETRRICEEARGYGLAAVYVLPSWVADAAEIFEGTQTAVGSVVGFPHGSANAATKAGEAAILIADGATEILSVVNISALKSGSDLIIGDEMQSVVDACAPGEAEPGFILEVALLTPEERRRVSKIAEEMGVTRLATETGFAPNASARVIEDVLADVRLIAGNVDEIEVVTFRHDLRVRDLAAFSDAGASYVACGPASLAALFPPAEHS